MADSGCLDCDRANIGVVWWPGFELFSRPSDAERCRLFLASFSFQFPTLNISPPTHNSLHYSPKVVLQRFSAFSVGAQHEAERKVCKSSSLLFWQFGLVFRNFQFHHLCTIMEWCVRSKIMILFSRSGNWLEIHSERIPWSTFCLPLCIGSKCVADNDSISRNAQASDDSN